MFRSKTMSCFRMVLPREGAWRMVNGLGELGCVEILDADPATPLLLRNFAAGVKRCEETLQRIQNLKDILGQFKMLALYRVSHQHQKLVSAFQTLGGDDGPKRLHDLEQQILVQYQMIEEQTTNYVKLKEDRDYHRRLIKSLVVAQQRIGKLTYTSETFQPLLGIIRQREVDVFERTVFRITRGNSCVSQSIYVIVSLGFAPSIHSKLVALCHSMAILQFELPKNAASYRAALQNSHDRIAELKQLIVQTKKEVRDLLSGLVKKAQDADCSQLELIRLYVLKECNLYEKLNLFRMHGNLCIGEAWIPTEQVPAVETVLSSSNPSGHLQHIQAKDIIPTYFKNNHYTKTFQLVVDTYGIPRYKEFNPTIIITVTFPFLFGVMFGDIYHGVCLTIFALFLCHYKRDLEHGKLKPLVQARYMLVMMGLFSIYAGVIYNDFAGLTVNFFGTCWEWHSEKSEWYPICTYPFGIDPVWMDQLSFMNSVKMKLSVIIAYLHMTLGILIMAFNQRAEGKKIGITSKFLPQLLFFTSTFGYMDLLIISKWTTSWSIPAQAPSIINTMIAMFLGLGTVDGPAMFAYQELIEKVLLAIAVISVPWMWLPHIINARYEQSSYFYVMLAEQHKLQVERQRRVSQRKTATPEHHFDIEDQIYEEGQEPGAPKKLDLFEQANGHGLEIHDHHEGQHANPQAGEIPILDQHILTPPRQVGEIELGELHHQKQEDYRMLSLINYIHQDDHLLTPKSQSMKDLDHQEEISEVVVHETIETIEFVLGCVSNTASYLRLWALSLAHSQLAQVFYELVLSSAVTEGSIPTLILLFPLWACATGGVLLVMDTMECFLHALRLHWVEFQNKFYKGDGVRFQPFSYVELFDTADG